MTYFECINAYHLRKILLGKPVMLDACFGFCLASSVRETTPRQGNEAFATSARCLRTVKLSICSDDHFTEVKFYIDIFIVKLFERQGLSVYWDSSVVDFFLNMLSVLN